LTTTDERVDDRERSANRTDASSAPALAEGAAEATDADDGVRK
jgi:hypothetical protein